jgi:AraC-like DNA-binding protein
MKSITEIALDAGFTNPGKFSETFKRRYGMTPTDYRNYEKLNTEME